MLLQVLKFNFSPNEFVLPSNSKRLTLKKTAIFSLEMFSLMKYEWMLLLMEINNYWHFWGSGFLRPPTVRLPAINFSHIFDTVQGFFLISRRLKCVNILQFIRQLPEVMSISCFLWPSCQKILRIYLLRSFISSSSRYPRQTENIYFTF